MTKQTYEFEFDENVVGRGWFNGDNLALLLYSSQHTNKQLLKVKEVKRTRRRILGNLAIGVIIAIGVGIVFLYLYLMFFVDDINFSMVGG